MRRQAVKISELAIAALCSAVKDFSQRLLTAHRGGRGINAPETPLPIYDLYNEHSLLSVNSPYYQ